MAQDLNQLMSDMRNSREVFVTQGGEVETPAEAEANLAQEVQERGTPQPRLSLKPTVFGE